MAEEKKTTDLKHLEQIVAMMVKNDLVEIEIKDGDNKIHLRRPEPQQMTAMPMHAPMMHAPANYPVAAPAASAPAAEVKDENLITIKSPIVGTFYSSPSPDSPAYVKVGDKVNPESVVCIIEAMKVMNEIKAELSGTITEIVAQNGQAIEYGQILFKLKK
jgi:acetyl-CoA carboxylase biotin carboxyl carrier protein